MALSDLGILESLAVAVRPAYFDFFDKFKAASNPMKRVGRHGYTSPAKIVSGKTFIVLELKGMPVHVHEDKQVEPLGEILLEGTINGTSWFELCRLRRDGTYNLAEVTRAQALAANNIAEAVVNGPARILIHKIRATVVKLPEDADYISLTLLGAN